MGLYAQYDAGEFENYDCTYSKEVMIPFNSLKNSTALLTNPPLNQIVFYTHRDQFSYWYKIIVKEDCTLGFKVDPIDTRDDYAVFVYQYNKNDFCDKVYQEKIQSVKAPFFLNKKDKEDVFDLSEKYFRAKKDNIYYISILSTSINNCGHFLKLYKGTDTLRVKAIHIPCARDLSIASKKVDLNITPAPDLKIRKDTISKVSAKEEDLYTLVRCSVGADKKGKLTGSKLRIVDELTGHELTIYPVDKEEFEFKIEKDKHYKVECSALGYKHFDHSIKISDAIKGTGGKLDIQLTPLKVGDNFIMKNIYFHPNTYALRKESEEDLARLLNYLLANPTIKIEIEGHTNGNKRIHKNKAYMNLGDEWNFSGSARKLSAMRAENIKTYLTRNGVNENRLVAEGYGGDRMIVPNPVTLEEGQQNIRVEIVILQNN